MTQKHLAVEKATDELIPDVAALANRLSPSHLAKEARGGGFLLPYSENEYRSFERQAEYFYVLRLEKELIGFVLAHSSAMIDLFGGEAYVHMKELETRPFIVVRQIGIAPECFHHGYAQRLYDFIYEHAKQDTARYAAMMCFVWKQPSNLASENFHRAVGWKEMETYQFESGGVVGIWARPITHP